MLGLALKLSLKFGMLKLDSLDFYPVSDFINILLASNKVISYQDFVWYSKDLLKKKNWNINRNTQGLAVLKASEDDLVKCYWWQN